MVDINNEDVKIKVALDIGTSKIRIAISEVKNNEKINILGYSEIASKGVKRGSIASLDQITKTLQMLKNDVEDSSKYQINSITVNVPAVQINNYYSGGAIKIPGEFITQSDIFHVLDIASTISVEPTHEIIHAFVQEYNVDHQKEIYDPVNLSGTRLESNVCVISCEKSAIANLTNSIKPLNIQVDQIVLQSVAASIVLDDEEKEQGVCLIDIGGGTTSIALFAKGTLYYTSVLPIGGNNVTNDLSKIQRTSTAFAEEIKVKYSSCPDKIINIPQLEGLDKKLSYDNVIDIIEARYIEIFEMVKDEIKKNGYDNLIYSAVLTGGGSLINNLADFSEQILHLKTRIGEIPSEKIYPEKFKSPEYATILGLLLNQENDYFQYRKETVQPLGFFSKLKQFSKKYF